MKKNQLFILSLFITALLFGACEGDRVIAPENNGSDSTDNPSGCIGKGICTLSLAGASTTSIPVTFAYGARVVFANVDFGKPSQVSPSPATILLPDPIVISFSMTALAARQPEQVPFFEASQAGYVFEADYVLSAELCNQLGLPLGTLIKAGSQSTLAMIPGTTTMTDRNVIRIPANPPIPVPTPTTTSN